MQGCCIFQHTPLHGLVCRTTVSETHPPTPYHHEMRNCTAPGARTLGMPRTATARGWAEGASLLGPAGLSEVVGEEGQAHDRFLNLRPMQVAARIREPLVSLHDTTLALRNALCSDEGQPGPTSHCLPDGTSRELIHFTVTSYHFIHCLLWEPLPKPQGP